MKHKSESFEKFKEFKAQAENQTGKSIKTLRLDRGGEYLSTEFIHFLKEHGIASQLTPPGTPQLNGVSERRNRTLLDMVRSMMSYTDLPISLWGFALQTASYILNRVPSKSVSTTPYEIWNGRKPSLKHVKIWGCPAFIKRLKSDKLDVKSIKGRFVGYPKDSLGFCFYLPAEQLIVVSRDAIFLEKEFLTEGGKGRKIMLNEESSKEAIQQNDQMAIDQPEEPIPIENVDTPTPRKYSRVSHPPVRYGFLHDVQELHVHEESIHVDDPTTFEEALLDKDSSRWLEAMRAEMDSMYANQVWSLVDPPEGVIPIRCKWIFKRKIGADGRVYTYRARLVVKEFH